MTRKILVMLLTVLTMCFITACGGSADGNGSGTEYEASTADTVSLSILPEKAELVPFKRFKEGFAFVSDTNWEMPPATLEEVQTAFGNDGVYYANCSYVSQGIDYTEV